MSENEPAAYHALQTFHQDVHGVTETRKAGSFTLAIASPGLWLANVKEVKTRGQG